MRWTARPISDPGAVSQLTAEVTKDPLLAALLVQRGITTFEDAKAFFRPDLNLLHHPYRMKDMERAVERIEKARIQQEHVMIFGDYDVDGTTSVALMAEFLEGKFPIEAYIPDRYKEGYGLSFDGINLAAELGITLIIALDCGIKAFDQIAHARSLGINVIVCDHHRPEETLPKAHAILDPKRSDCPYPYKELSGCGVGFKLCQALCEHWGLPEDVHLHPLLDLCAVSIAADIVHVTGENRLLAHYGLQRIRNGQARAGFMSLLEASGKAPESLNLRDIAFSIAPRINAAGRMESGLRAVELLRSTDRAEQDELAERINAFNQDRRETQAKIFVEAKEELDPENYPNSNVLYRPHWHKGVVGIVASKIVETRYRPTIILTKSGDHLGGSARSVIGFDVYNAIEACDAHILQFGGHKYAAGLTLDEAQLPHFRKAFEAYCAENVTAEMKTPELEYDAVASLDQFTDRFYAVLSQMEPHGEANQAPRFLIENLVDAGGGKAVGADQSHLRVVLQHPGCATTMTGIAFEQGAWVGHLKAGGAVDIIASLEINEFRGQRNLQLMIEDIRSAQGKS